MEEKLLEIINSILINKGMSTISEFKPEDDLREDYGFTSFDLAELTVGLEDEFDVDIFEGGLIRTVGEIIKKISKYR